MSLIDLQSSAVEQLLGHVGRAAEAVQQIDAERKANGDAALGLEVPAVGCFFRGSMAFRSPQLMFLPSRCM